MSFLVSDVHQNFFSFCDTNTLIALSGVSKQLNAALPNEPFFKDRFFSHHPLLKPPHDVKIFTVLRSHHSSNCWKMMCKLMQSTSPVQKWNPSFLAEALPHISADRQLKKQQAESKIKEICGSHYADPHSPIDQAWKKYQKCQEELNSLEQSFSEYMASKKKEVLPLKKELKHTYLRTEEEIEGIIHGTAINSAHLINTPEEKIQEKTGMTIDKFRMCRQIARIYEEYPTKNEQLNRKFVEFDRLQEAYQELEQERKDREAQHNSTQADLSTLNSNPSKLLSMHGELLNSEREAALILEAALKLRPHLQECLALIKKLIEHPEEQFPEAFDRIREMINALPHRDKTWIWEKLYFQCTGGNISEDAWAEKHFPNHLMTLGYAVAEHLANINWIIDPESPPNPVKNVITVLID